MELTSQRQAEIVKLDDDLQHTVTIDNLRQSQETIIKTIEEEREANQKAFDKGAEKFDDLYKEVGEMKKQITEGFRVIRQDISDHITQGKDDEIKKLNKKLDGRDQVKNGVIITLVGGIVLYVAIHLFELLRPIGNLPPQ